MSDTQQSNGRSSNVNQMSSAQKVQRMAIARQSPDSGVEAAIPPATSVDAVVGSLFDEDGSLISAEDAMDVEVESDGEFEVEDAEAFLTEVAPERLEKLEAKFEALPGTKEDLMTYHAQKVISEAEERGEALHVESGGELLEVTIHQEEGQDKWEAIDNTMNDDGKTLDECPKCGAEDVSASQVEIQTKGADESGTQVTKTGCGCTIRRSD